MDPRPPRRAVWRDELGELAERITRVETTVGHLQETLTRIDGGMGSMQLKLDALAGTIAEGRGGLRVGAVVWKALAAAGGFVAAHVWPVGK
jgi:hypothetical protein